MIVFLARFSLVFVVLTTLCIGGCTMTANALSGIDVNHANASQELDAAKMSAQLRLASSEVQVRLEKEKEERVKVVFARRAELLGDSLAALARIEQMRETDPWRYSALSDVRIALTRMEPISFAVAGKRWGQMIVLNGLVSLALALPYLIRHFRQNT